MGAEDSGVGRRCAFRSSSRADLRQRYPRPRQLSPCTATVLETGTSGGRGALPGSKTTCCNGDVKATPTAHPPPGALSRAFTPKHPQQLEAGAPASKAAQRNFVDAGLVFSTPPSASGPFRRLKINPGLKGFYSFFFARTGRRQRPNEPPPMWHCSLSLGPPCLFPAFV